MTTDAIGLYIHIPFCVRKCRYCDFASVRHNRELASGYVDRLLSEIYSYKRESRIPVDTVYFGGGTPSLMAPEVIEKILTGVRESFDLSHGAEITMESNPGTLTRENIRRYRDLGVNRISVGLQSCNERELQALGRIHTLDTFLDSFEMLREAGFDNISVDLMYGIPYQTRDSFAATLDKVISLSPEHISVYGLIVEEGTPFFYERDSLPLPCEDEECDMYYLAHRELVGHGYSHYEISNYAKQGKESKHNLKYWQNKEFIGVGVAAYSYFEGVRYGNTRDLSDYLCRCDAVEYREIIRRDDEMYEYAMMHLRLSSGISLKEYEARFGVPFTCGREALIDKYISLSLACLSGGRFYLTERGFYVSNTILSELL